MRSASPLTVVVGAAAALALGGGGCRSSAPPRGGSAELTAASATPPPTAQPLTLSALSARMHEHDVHGAAMRDALARGDLDVARREAKILAELRVDGAADPAWRTRLAAMNAAAERVTNASGLSETSSAVAEVARTCGDCHRLGGPPASTVETPENERGVAAGMKRHQWAVTQLWDGLVIPSDRAWRAGAHVLRDAPLEPTPPGPGQSPVATVGELAIAVLATSVHDLGARASVANASVDRGAVFGELMTTCAACHARFAHGLR